MLLTGVLVFVAPQSWVQAAMACMFAFGILLGFELMRPHVDPADVWLYRLVSQKRFVSTKGVFEDGWGAAAVLGRCNACRGSRKGARVFF